MRTRRTLRQRNSVFLRSRPRRCAAGKGFGVCEVRRSEWSNGLGRYAQHERNVERKCCACSVHERSNVRRHSHWRRPVGHRLEDGRLLGAEASGSRCSGSASSTPLGVWQRDLRWSPERWNKLHPRRMGRNMDVRACRVSQWHRLGSHTQERLPRDEDRIEADRSVHRAWSSCG